MDAVQIQKMGSVVGVRRCGKENAPRLVLDAHLDEIGFIITGHEDGFLRFASLGGVDPRMLPDREVTILTDPPMLGVVACLPPHVQSREDMDKSQPIQELFIDIGQSKENAKKLVPVGTPAVYHTSCVPLGEDLICGKSLDDRACFAILLDTVQRLAGEDLDVDVYVVGSTQEETHSTGAITAAYGIIPDLCVAVDVTHGDSRMPLKIRRSGWEGALSLGLAQTVPLDVPEAAGQGAGAGYGLPAGSHGWSQRYQRMAPSGEPGRCGYRRPIPTTAVYAYPSGNCQLPGSRSDGRASCRLYSGHWEGGPQLCLSY